MGRYCIWLQQITHITMNLLLSLFREFIYVLLRIPRDERVRDSRGRFIRT